MHAEGDKVEEAEGEAWVEERAVEADGVWVGVTGLDRARVGIVFAPSAEQRRPINGVYRVISRNALIAEAV